MSEDAGGVVPGAGDVGECAEGVEGNPEAIGRKVCAKSRLRATGHAGVSERCPHASGDTGGVVPGAGNVGSHLRAAGRTGATEQNSHVSGDAGGTVPGAGNVGKGIEGVERGPEAVLLGGWWVGLQWIVDIWAVREALSKICTYARSPNLDIFYTKNDGQKVQVKYFSHSPRFWRSLRSPSSNIWGGGALKNERSRVKFEGGS
ncbi:hypothetical protein BDZ94DRAFT_1242088 [Collybia nuda]|uniref:Uncharacterized protein n=1 Tax=Collybia nuda TaxID=64659 RepID=A0A9P6C884_9AGAR|nr:hypothetical protein BDZ94DRAFT_1242088 [Collybia nuda]